MNDTYFENAAVQTANFSADVYFDYFNERMRIDDFRGDPSALWNYIEEKTNEHAFAKVILKCRNEYVSFFLQHGFVPEAYFKGYYNGSDCQFLSRFFTNERRNSCHWAAEDATVSQILQKEQNDTVPPLAEGITIRLAVEKDASSLAALYGTVFKVYPTPMNDPAYIIKVMKEGTVFYCAEKEGEIVSAASAEILVKYHNAELTDCATLEDYRKYGLMKILIAHLEEELVSRSIYCAYSLARALSFGMNAVFHQRGYTYGGRLANNCIIFEDYEDMNLWVKDLSNIKR
ncbi:putative beta-lysine N-acetyltransferase [Fictibacillus aquaticus]|uniref:Putative beta-lysine N-acetyltransferase n=1 Tax=Fictibacillus aquaticus TaxID=2021314 RepID=A0A235FCQ6_9BACL|nr:putative beta-lysine N-acetyltransferase [Fictibacillus aquaticus]OYD58713.1 putative beta-lysine N-acetyltransferase [Fictibacillus aquaticus]